MLLQIQRLLLFGFMGAVLASADQITFSLSTTGSFSSGTPTDLSFVGIGSASKAGFTGVTVGGALTLTDLGTFTLLEPTHGADTYHNDSFTLDVIFFVPAGINGQTTFDAALHGTVNTQQGSVLIDFGPAQTFTYTGSSSGSFNLTIDDLSLNIPHNGATSVTQLLTGSIANANASDPPQDSPVPEPLSIVLLGTVTVLVASRIRRGQGTGS